MNRRGSPSGAAHPRRIARLAPPWAALWLSAGAAGAAPYDPVQDRAALREASAACAAAVERLGATALAKDKIPALLELVDRAAYQADASSVAASRLAAAARPPHGDMEAALRGRGKALGVEAEAAEMGAALARERARVAKDHKRAEEIKERLPKPAATKGDAKLEARTEERRRKLEDAKYRLDRGEWELRRVWDAAEALDKSVRSMKEHFLRAGQALADLERAASEMARNASALRQDSSPARAAIGALGTEPEALRRTRATQAIDPLVGESRGVFQAADSAWNRSEDFRIRNEGFGADLRRFRSARKEGEAGLEAAAAQLADAEKLLAEAEKE